MPALVNALSDRNESVRHFAAVALRLIGAEAKDAVPALVNALGDRNEYVRHSAATALGNIGAEAKDAVPALVNALESSGGNPFYKESIKRALQRIQA